MSAGIDRAFVIQECLIPRLWLLMLLLGLLRRSSLLIFLACLALVLIGDCWHVRRCFDLGVFLLE